VDSHTLLACKLLSMCGFRIIAMWTLTLLKLGYEVHGIEHSVHVKGGNVSPDIILTNSGTGHALVIDCKSGANVDQGQDSRYGQITVNCLHKAGMPPISAATPPYTRSTRSTPPGYANTRATPCWSLGTVGYTE